MTKMTSPNKTFFTSDLHLFHSNIIKYCDRPFSNAQDMNRAILERWNAKIPKDGLTYILGDVSMNATPGAVVGLLNGLNGEKILISGNHDSHLLKDEEFRRCFTSIHNFLEIYIQDEEMDVGRAHITLCHYAMRTWNKAHHGSWQLYGHTHGTMKGEGAQMDVGVDTNDMYPYSYEDVKFKLWKLATKQVKQSKGQQLKLDL